MSCVQANTDLTRQVRDLTGWVHTFT